MSSSNPSTHVANTNTTTNPKIKPFKFTTQSIKALPKNQSPTATELEVSDTEIIGLKCLVGRSGNKRFLFRYQYQGKKQSLAMGRFPEVSVGGARIIATRWGGLMCCGINPKSERESKTEFNKDNAAGMGNNQDGHTHSADLTVSQFFWQVYLPYVKQRKRSWDKDVSRFQCYLENQIGHLRYFELKAIHIQKNPK